ncbi:hypothetical protein FWH13_01540 [Candidatus Saccharibacteria bacterium]|nr:hypothetical protein [Candidatus Saccharibacteria bacterium]
MAISGDLLKINGQPVVGLSQHRISYAKLWSEAERNMSGDLRATYAGGYPRLELEIGGILTSDRVQQLIQLLDTPYLSVTFYNPKIKNVETAQYYAGDFQIELLERERELYKPFTVNLIPFSRSVS